MDKIDKENIILGVVSSLGIEEYIDFLKEKFNIKSIVDVKKTVKESKSTDLSFLKYVDIFLFTGGTDVNPKYYNEKTGKYTTCNNERDELEWSIFRKLRYSTLKLGICRGAQLLTVLSKGKLIQHVNNHNRDHNITNIKSIYNSSLKMTSSHHQMMYPFNIDKKDYDIIAFSENFLSTIYLNGKNEEIELPSNFVEPEIVYYKNTNSLCIQGHPEYSNCSRNTRNFCNNLIEKYYNNMHKIH